MGATKHAGRTPQVAPSASIITTTNANANLNANVNAKHKPTRLTISRTTNNRKSVRPTQTQTFVVSQHHHQQQQIACGKGISKKHLAARAKTIIGKLLESHGAELRRTLFSLRQMFEDNPGLAVEFIESDGLECLMKVAIDADQIHQSYILRALGQLIVYPSGMNGLSRHNGTIRWLYSLLVSQHQLVARTSVKLLVLFVEHSGSNCLQLCRIIRSMDEAKGAITWTNLIELLKNKPLALNQQPQQDVSLLVEAMTLVNKTLSGIVEPETFSNSVESLEKLGLSKIIEDYSSLNCELRKQFQTYEKQIANSKLLNQDNSNNSSKTINMDNLAESSNSDLNQAARRRRSRLAPTETSGDDDDTDNNNLSCEATGGRGQPESHTDDNYESANESNESQNGRQVEAAAASTVSSSDADSEPQTTPTRPTTNKTDINVRRRQQLRQQPRHQQQQQRHREQATNLARGKQQRASISSCSSSDSYASYGSGYASGSGNSTDHELKQRSLNKGAEPNSQATMKRENNDGRPHNRIASSSTSHDDEREDEEEEEDDEVDDVGDDDDDGGRVNGHDVGIRREDNVDNDDDDDDDDSQLKQHLSELEQLTDELASRNIFGILSQPLQSTSKQQHHLSSSNIDSKSTTTSSKSSSIISTGSNNIIQSLSPTDEAPLPGADSRVQPPQPLSPVATTNNESRSTSATPTSTVQPNSTSTLEQTVVSPPLPSSSCPTDRQSSGDTNNFQQASTSAKRSSPINQYTMLPPTARFQAGAISSPHQSPIKGAGGATSVATPTKQQQQQQQQQEPYYHNLFQWEQLVSKGVTRPLLINDLDFTDLRDEDDCDLMLTNNQGSRTRANPHDGEPLTINIPNAQQQILNDLGASGDNCSPKSRAANSTTPASAPPPLPPPPISPWFNTVAGSRPQSQFMSSPSPPFELALQQQLSTGEFRTRDQSPTNSTYSSYSRNSVCVPATSTPTRDTPAHQLQYSTLQPATSLRSASSMSSLLFGNKGKYANGKRKKTMKLFWKEVREDRSLLSKLTKKKTIWDEIKPVEIDTQKLEYLFESKAKDLMLSKSRLGLDGANQRKVKITVLDAKRSNAINIGMTKLPPMRTIKSAILKMDSSIMNREGIEKILTTMMPSEEEKSRIIEAQLANPDTPLGTAEQFLLNLASISALEARLKLWAFQLDYAQIEKEVAEPLMDLKQAIEEIERSETFRIVLGTLLAIGNFLNSTNAKGFQIDYLEKVPEVKDTVHKHSLLHHLCLFIQDKFDPQLTGDLYSEFSAVNRASKVDYTEVAKNLKKMQLDCKASWDYLKIVAKHDGLANLMNTSCSSSTSTNNDSSSTLSSMNGAATLGAGQQTPRSAGKLNNLSKLSMITTVSSDASSCNDQQQQGGQQPSGKQLKTKVSDFLTDCAERIMVLMVIHRRVMNRFQKLLVYLGCPTQQIKQTQPQQVLKIINEFALEYRTKRERVREMLMKKQQCHQHQHHNLGNRWQMSRSRWAGSQQCIDTLGYNYHQRPCSTTSSCASSYAPNSNCADSVCNMSLVGDPRHHGSHSQQISGNRPSSPSGYSQISNYSDYLFDQSCCNSRQQSVTPVPVEEGSSRINQHQQHLMRRPHSMSISMFDLQNQQNGRENAAGVSNGGNNTINCPSGSYNAGNCNRSARDDDAHQKDEQLRRLLGAGKSLDGACQDLYQMSHWSSTMARVSRHPPLASQGLLNKQRAASIDSTGKIEETEAGDMAEEHQQQRQSSYYRYLHNGECSLDEPEQNSDDEILQSLVRTATAKSSHGGHHGSSNRSSTSGSHSSANKSAKNKILSRFSCDRKSCEYQPIHGSSSLASY